MLFSKYSWYKQARNSLAVMFGVCLIIAAVGLAPISSVYAGEGSGGSSGSSGSAAGDSGSGSIGGGGPSPVSVGGSASAVTSSTFTVCDDRHGETGRSIEINTTGRVRINKITCP